MSMDIVRKINRLMAAGDYVAAQKRIRPLAKKEPRNAGLQNMAGLTFARGGQHKAALPYFAAAVKAAPEQTDFRCNLTLSLVLCGEDAKAAGQIDRLISAAPDDARPWHMRAMLHQRAGAHDEAVKAATQALTRDPQMADALNLRAVAYTFLRDDAAALADFEAAAARRPDDSKTLRQLGKQLSQMGLQERALEAWGQALQLTPGHPNTLARVAEVCPPDTLPQVREAAEKALAARPADPADRAQLMLAGATAMHRSGQASDAMELLHRLHALDARHHSWDRRAARDEFERMTSLFPAPADIARPAAQTPSPVFVTGLPRSGTTLVEMILSRVPGVAARGELPMAAARAQAFLATGRPVTAEALANFAEGFRTDMPPVPEEASVFTDKMPANFRYIGLLADTFPDARFVCVGRDPRDVALSMWRRRFVTEGMNFASRLSDIADYANLFALYMRHWQATCADRILTVRYEDLVSDMDSGTRAIAEHCGLAWTEKMLHPEESDARVETASKDQVRARVHTRSVGGWQRFAGDFKEFTDNLDPDLWPGIATPD